MLTRSNKPPINQTNNRNERQVNNMKEKRIKELEKKLDTVCGTYENDCNKCPYQKECNEYYRLKNNK